MDIVLGRGNKRQVISLPAWGSIWGKGEEALQAREAVKGILRNAGVSL